MPTRSPAVAGMFYPADETSCRAEVEALRPVAHRTFDHTVLGGIVPHAGWAFSGGTAVHLFAALNAQEPPETVVLFGAVHRYGGSTAAVYGSGAWQTPLGALEVDEQLAEAVLQATDGAMVEDPQAHDGEHSIEVQLPFIKYLFPDARILPIAVPPARDAHEVGRRVARAVRALGRRAPGLGSTDLTHYGPRYGFAPAGVGDAALEWAKGNDRRLLDKVTAMQATDVMSEARMHYNACGPGAIAAAIAYAVELGAGQGLVLHYTTSQDVMPMGRPTDWVGYAAVAFL